MNRAIQTVKEMISQRGYKNIEENDEYIIGNKNKEDKIVFFIQPVSKFNVEQSKIFIKKLKNIGINHGIVIYTDNVTSTARKALITSLEYKIELFTLIELQFNLTKHRLVPEHVPLSKIEVKNFKIKYNNKWGKFPIILKSDPVSRFYDFGRGDIIKIIRQGGYTSYRIVK
jgi:DNA-directed RNA polymerase I, II, and III subunit RPABC1